MAGETVKGSVYVMVTAETQVRPRPISPTRAPCPPAIPLQDTLPRHAWTTPVRARSSVMARRPCFCSASVPLNCQTFLPSALLHFLPLCLPFLPLPAFLTLPFAHAVSKQIFWTTISLSLSHSLPPPPHPPNTRPPASSSASRASRKCTSPSAAQGGTPKTATGPSPTRSRFSTSPCLCLPLKPGCSSPGSTKSLSPSPSLLPCQGPSQRKKG